MEAANGDMERNPSQGQPARPVTAKEHVHSANNRDQMDEARPHDVILKRMPQVEVGQMVYKPDCTRR